MKVLAVDCGNTRIKYTLSDAGPGKVESMPLGETAAAMAARWNALRKEGGEPQRIMISNVAGDGVAASLAQSLQVFAVAPEWVRPRGRQCGVVNCYDDPAQLGSDRWAAAIAAWNLERDVCLVVNAGTATTIDAVSQRGEFLGGLILPGLSMMRASLAAGTAALPLADGQATEFPRNTADAIWNGCLAAQTGAIERMWRSLPESATCLLSGGAAPALYAALNMPCLVVDNLVLEGLLLIAREQ
ncbi:MAG: type III pantothenate kinase [Rhodospirillales bacterium]